MNLRNVLSVGLIVFGVLLLLEHVFDIQFGIELTDWWPIIIVLMGTSMLRNSGNFAIGIVIISFGIVLIGSNLDIINISIGAAIWPFILILIGVSLLKSHGFKRHERVECSDSDLNISAIFSGTQEKVDSDNFTGGEIRIMFGAVELDLRQARLAPEGAVLHVHCAMAGVEMQVPPDWNIKMKGSPIMGAMENKTNSNHSYNPEAPTLVIESRIIMGGIEIKN